MISSSVKSSVGNPSTSSTSTSISAIIFFSSILFKEKAERLRVTPGKLTGFAALIGVVSISFGFGISFFTTGISIVFALFRVVLKTTEAIMNGLLFFFSPSKVIEANYIKVSSTSKR